MANKNNKILPQKVARMATKKFDLESKDSNTHASKTSSNDYEDPTPPSSQHSKPVFKGMPGIKNDIGGGFYFKSKPIKSPQSSSSSASKSLKGPSKMTGK